MNINQKINQAEREVEIEYNKYILSLGFFPKLLKDKLQHDLIKRLNAIVNKYTDSKVFLYEWKNVFKKERQGIAENKLSNIKRVLRTEIHEKHNQQLNKEWAENPNIIGRRIRLSRTGKNHCEICKNMAGVYPLSFKWVSWHPRCQCEQFPIYGKPGQTIKVPKKSLRFIELNKTRFDNWKNKPYWLETLTSR